MGKDMCVPCENGLINIRVGAIILKDNKLLMVRNLERPNYYYTVGGRIQFGEETDEAIIREVYEETGYKMKIDHLAYIHENYFYSDTVVNKGKLVYEISFFYYMQVPEDFAIKQEVFLDGENEEYLEWIDVDTDILYYPKFLKEEIKKKNTGLKFFTTNCQKDIK